MPQRFKWVNSARERKGARSLIWFAEALRRVSACRDESGLRSSIWQSGILSKVRLVSLARSMRWVRGLDPSDNWCRWRRYACSFANI